MSWQIGRLRRGDRAIGPGRAMADAAKPLRAGGHLRLEHRGDPIAEAAFKSLNVNPIPLTITDVLTSLQTNLVNGVYTSPLAAIALQWFSRTKYMLNVPLADAAGAVVISQKKFQELPPDLQAILTIGTRPSP